MPSESASAIFRMYFIGPPWLSLSRSSTRTLVNEARQGPPWPRACQSCSRLFAPLSAFAEGRSPSYLLHYTNASFIMKDGVKLSEDGLFSGFDPATQTYDTST